MSEEYNISKVTRRLDRLARLLDYSTAVLLIVTGLYLGIMYAGLLTVGTRLVVLSLSLMCAGWILYPKGVTVSWHASHPARLRKASLAVISRLTWLPIRSLLLSFRILTINR